MAAVPVAVASVLVRREGATRLGEPAALTTMLLVPPLLGFIVFHARLQTVQRQQELGLPTIGADLRRVAPVLAGAAAVLAVAAVRKVIVRGCRPTPGQAISGAVAVLRERTGVGRRSNPEPDPEGRV